MNDKAGNRPLTSIWQAPGFTETMIAVACAFGAWSLLLPVLPLAVLDSGGSASLAGWSTGIFMAATVLTQMATPWMLRNVGYRLVMVGSAFMLGVPALGHLIGMDAWAVLLFSALRGVGFGSLTVAESALIAEILPLRFLGKGTGTMGVFIGISQMIGLPAGLWITDVFGYPAVYILAAAVGLFAALMCLRLPRIKAAPSQESVPVLDGEGKEVPTVSMWKLVLVPALALTTVTMGFGIISSFLPAAVRDLDASAGAVLAGLMLSITGGASMVARYVVGVIADRTGNPGGLIIPAQLISFIGLVLIALTLLNGWSVGILVIAAIFFGVGFGALQNEALLTMFHRLPRSRVSEASAVWNIFYDAGTGIGSVVFGAIVAATSYAGGFGVSALIVILGVLGTGADVWLGRHRVTDYDNISTRLRRVVRRRK